MLGKPVAERLLKDGFTVSVLTRDPERATNKLGNGYAIFKGDVMDPESIHSAMETCDGVHINLSSSSFRELKEVEYPGTLNVIQAAKQNNLKRITIITGAGVCKENTWSKMIGIKYKIEKEVLASGIPYTIFAPTHFMDSIPKYIKGDQAMIIGKQPAKIHWVAAYDYAKIVSRAYQGKESENKKLWIMGPEAYTMEEAFKIYCTKKCKNISVSRIPLTMMYFMAAISFNSKLKYVASLMRYFNKMGEMGDPSETNELLWKPEITLEKWMETV